jgi:hypothetical protein
MNIEVTKGCNDLTQILYVVFSNVFNNVKESNDNDIILYITHNVNLNNCRFINTEANCYVVLFARANSDTLIGKPMPQ